MLTNGVKRTFLQHQFFQLFQPAPRLHSLSYLDRRFFVNAQQAFARRDYYEILGVSRGASIEQIKESFRRLALVYHPDQSIHQEKRINLQQMPSHHKHLLKDNGREEMFLMVKEAYEVLANFEKKKEFDKYIHNFSAQQYQHYSDQRQLRCLPSRSSGQRQPRRESVSQWAQRERNQEQERIRQEIERWAELDKKQKEAAQRAQAAQENKKMEELDQIREAHRRAEALKAEKRKMEAKNQMKEEHGRSQEFFRQEQKLYQEEMNLQKERMNQHREAVAKQQRIIEEEYLREHERKVKVQEELKKQFEKEREKMKMRKGEEAQEGEREEKVNGGIRERKFNVMPEEVEFDSQKIQEALQGTLKQNRHEQRIDLGDFSTSNNSILGIFLFSTTILGLIVYFFLSQNKENESSSASTSQLQHIQQSTQFQPYEIVPKVAKTLRIHEAPIEVAQEPQWMIKKKQGQKLDALDKEEIMKYNYDKDYESLKRDNNRWSGLPSWSKILQIINITNTLKKQCVISQLGCSLRYNRAVFSGVGDECGSLDPFKTWREEVDEKKSRKIVEDLITHFDFPLFTNVGQSRKAINAFFQAKYGVFTCYDSDRHIGEVDFDADLIAYWERKRLQGLALEVQVELDFHLVLGHGLCHSVWLCQLGGPGTLQEELQGHQTVQELHQEKPRPLVRGQRCNSLQIICFQIIVNIKCANLMERLKKEGLEKSKKEELEVPVFHQQMQNLFRKIKFYKENGSYLVPKELKKYVEKEFQSEEELFQELQKQIEKKKLDEILKIENKKKYMQQRQIPQHILLERNHHR